MRAVSRQVLWCVQITFFTCQLFSCPCQLSLCPLHFLDEQDVLTISTTIAAGDDICIPLAHLLAASYAVYFSAELSVLTNHPTILPPRIVRLVFWIRSPTFHGLVAHSSTWRR